MDTPSERLFLLDGMALVYRAHFAFINRPIFTSYGLNTSALFGYANTLAELIQNWKPTHMAVAFDTEAPTERHRLFPDYKARRQEMPEDLSRALPHLRRVTEAFNISVLTCDGFEADDIIGTATRWAEERAWESFMVTPDKDFGQLVSERTFMFRPARMGDGAEVLGVSEILKKWGIERVDQVIDILALWGDASDNIPGVPGVGEKTAQKLIAQFGSLEALFERLPEVKGKLRDKLAAHREQAFLSKKLATIDRAAPVQADLDAFRWNGIDEAALKSLFVEFEFESIGRRFFGDSFKARPGAAAPDPASAAQGEFLLPAAEPRDKEASEAPPRALLKTLKDVKHEYRIADSAERRAALVRRLLGESMISFDLETSDLDPKRASICGIAFSTRAGDGDYAPLPEDEEESGRILEEFRPVFEAESIEKVGHNLKFDLSVLKWRGVEVRGPLFDTMLAHTLVAPEMRHTMDYLAEVCLGYHPVPITELIGEKKGGQISMREVPVERAAEYAVEDADVTLQLRHCLAPQIEEKGQGRVFYEIEAPLVRVLVDMEAEGIRLDESGLAEVSAQLAREIAECERDVARLAGSSFNLNSPRQLGDILFNVLKIGDKPKKTKTGQFATNEQTLTALAPRHEIVRRILDYRACSKLKSTYVDLLPAAVHPRTGRIHTTYNQLVAATGRLASQNPNLQNIPIRTEQGREIRKAFVPRDADRALLAADYSQIELRIIASLSGDPGMIEAFQQDLDIHTATAAKVFGVALDDVTSEMRRKAKMVNFGIIYGISAFGLAQRLGIPRHEAGGIIDAYFARYRGVRRYLDATLEFARERGYVETMSGRRRPIRDIASANATIRGAAEREAINAPVQGTAADMIKIAMVRIHEFLKEEKLETRMLLQVHDELVFDLVKSEESVVVPRVVELMKTALPLKVPIAVEIGMGRTWLEAH